MTISSKQSVGRSVEQEPGHEVTWVEADDVDEGPGVIDPRPFKHSNKNTTEPDPGIPKNLSRMKKFALLPTSNNNLYTLAT